MVKVARTTRSEHVNEDGSTTTTTVTYNADGSKSTKRTTNNRSSSPTLPKNRARSKTPPPSGTRTPPPPSRSSATSKLTSYVEHLVDVLGVGHKDDHVFQQKVQRAIPAQIVLLASQDDVTQAQEDFFARDHYQLPAFPYHTVRSASGNKLVPNKTGSVATCALLQLLLENPKRFVASSGSNPWNCRQLLQEIQSRIQTCSKLEARPVISSSRPLGPPALKNDKYAPFYIVPPGHTGTRRALLVGVSTGGEEFQELQGPPNDIAGIEQFLLEHCGFQQNNMIVLRDDKNAPNHCRPSTKKNILDGFAKMAQLSKSSDVVFIQFSGHGGRLGDNLYILPSDCETQGHILDQDILIDLIKYMPANVHTTMLVDCCYSGTIGDLPYMLNSQTAQQGGEQEIETYYDVDTRQEMIEKEEQAQAQATDSTSSPSSYQEKKKARSKWKQVMRLPSVAATYASDLARDAGHGFWDAANAANAARLPSVAATYASDLARDAGHGFWDAAHAAREAAREAQAKAVQKYSDATATTTSTADTATPKATTKTTPSRTRSVSPSPQCAGGKTTPRPTKSLDDMELFPKTAIPRSTPRHTKTIEEIAKEEEDAARRRAVARSRNEAARERSRTPPPSRTKSTEEIAREQDDEARRRAVAKSKRDAARERSRTPPRRTKTLEEIAKEEEEDARKRAVARSKTEAARERSKTPPRSRA